MTEETASADKSWQTWHYRLDVLAALVMSAAVVLSAFSAWQATRWSGVQATAFAQASSARTQSVSELGTANAQIAYDAITFAEFAIEFRGALSDPELLAEALEVADRLVRDEFRVALDAWIALAQNDPDAPRTPFDLPEYTNARQEEAGRLQGEAEESFEEAKDANQNGDDYVLATVFFASVLFFAGISTKFVDLRIQGAMLAFAAIALSGGVLRIATLPFH